MRRLALIVLAAGGLTALPALAAPSASDVAFVAEFENACVPGRLTYPASIDAATKAGWTATDKDVHPSISAIIAMSEEEAATIDLDEASFEYQVFTKPFEATTLHLIVSRTGALLAEGEEPFVQVGCYLYNFDAKSPIDPEPVTTLLGNAIADSPSGDGAINHVWGPSCSMPRTFDTYLNFVRAGSEIAQYVPFTGAALSFSTSELPEGEPVPDPYC